MHAAAAVRFESGPFGDARITRLRSEPPLVLCDTSSGLMMLGAAAGPLGGDRWTLDVSVGAGCSARIGSVAATVAQPGLAQARSSFEIEADVDTDATLRWSPEPLVVAAGATHYSRIDIALAPSSRLSWREIVVLGRHGQLPGRAVTRWRVRRGGLPLFAHDLDIGTGAPAGWDGPAVLAGSRVLGSLLVVDPVFAADPVFADDSVAQQVSGAAVFTLAGPAVLVVARGQTTIEVAAALANASAALTAATV